MLLMAIKLTALHWPESRGHARPCKCMLHTQPNPSMTHSQHPMLSTQQCQLQFDYLDEDKQQEAGHGCIYAMQVLRTYT